MKEELLYDRYDTENMTVEELKTLIWRYFISYWNNRRICSVNDGLSSMVKRQRYYESLNISASDAIVELCRDEKSKVTSAFLVTKQLEDSGLSKHETKVPILRIPAIAFLYRLGKAEEDGQNGKM